MASWLAIIFCGNFDSRQAIIVISPRETNTKFIASQVQVGSQINCVLTEGSFIYLSVVFWGLSHPHLGLHCAVIPQASGCGGGALMKHFPICPATPPNQPLAQGEIDGSRSTHNRTCWNNNIVLDVDPIQPQICGPRQLISNCICRCHYV